MNHACESRHFLIILIVNASALGARVEAQSFQATPTGYPNVGEIGDYGVGTGFYGGPGNSPYQGASYGVGSGRLTTSANAAIQVYRHMRYTPVPQTVTNFTPLYNAITSIPGWNATSVAPRPRPRPQPTVPRDQLLSGDGKILWPSAAPATPARQAAEESVHMVVREAQDAHNATIRHVVDARNKLNAYARETLSSVKARNAADAAGLERFIVELEKTLQTLALNY